MFTLNHYVNSLLELVLEEKSKKKRLEIIKAWVKTLKSHHRDLEAKKILKILDSKIGELTQKAQVTVSDEKEGKAIGDYLKKKKIGHELEVNPELLGGVRIVWNNILVDNSIASQLEKLNKSIQ